MKFDTASDKIILISYPSGGFGNFIYYILSTFAKETVKTNQNNFDFSDLGNSHSTYKYTRVWFKNPDHYAADITIDPKNSSILVLCDNGINDDNYLKIRKFFPNATLLKLIISESVRPVIYKTCVYKAMQSDLHIENLFQIKKHWQDAEELYAQRENFTLMYHNWPFAWSEQTGDVNLDLENLIVSTKDTIEKLIQSLNLTPCNLGQLEGVLDRWYQKNKKYFDIYYQSKEIMSALQNNRNINLDHINDLHDQGYINFLLEKNYDIIIPVYTYKHWFNNTEQISAAIGHLRARSAK